MCCGSGGFSPIEEWVMDNHHQPRDINNSLWLPSSDGVPGTVLWDSARHFSFYLQVKYVVMMFTAILFSGRIHCNSQLSQW